MYIFCEFVFQWGRQRRSSRWRRWERYGGRRSATSVDWRRTTSACTGVSGPPCKCPNTSKGACVKVSPSVHVYLVWACCATTPTSRVTRTCCSPTHSSSRPNWLFLKPVSSKTWSSTASRDRLEFVSDCYRQALACNSTYEDSATDSYCSASEKLLKTWQENQEKADEFMKVWIALIFHHSPNSPEVFYSERVTRCRLQMWRIWTKRSWLYILKLWSCKGVHLPEDKWMWWNSCQ